MHPGRKGRSLGEFGARCIIGRVDDSKVQVSEFEAADQGEVQRLIVGGLGEHWGHIDVTLNPDLDDIGASYGHGYTVVVRGGGDIVATGTVVPHDPSTAEIIRMSVAAEHRRSGLGRLVVDELLSRARSWGVSAIVLETSTHWTDVVSFYLSCGFTITHRESGSFGEDTWFRLEL